MLTATNNKRVKVAKGADQMVSLGQKLGAAIVTIMAANQCGFVVFLQGDLGMGKTTLVRGIIRHFGYQGAVKSPTYTLVEPYTLPLHDNQATININHFDLYRLMDKEELEYLGIRDYFTQDTLNLIEWPDRGEVLLPEPDLVIAIDGGTQQRTLTLHGLSKTGTDLLHMPIPHDGNS